MELLTEFSLEAIEQRELASSGNVRPASSDSRKELGQSSDKEHKDAGSGPCSNTSCATSPKRKQFISRI
jgi:hypothetical protein